jgi:hypothetical protein
MADCDADELAEAMAALDGHRREVDALCAAAVAEQVLRGGPPSQRAAYLENVEACRTAALAQLDVLQAQVERLVAKVH